MMMMKSNNGHGSYGNSPRDPLLNQLNPQYHNHHHSFASNGNHHLSGSPLSSNQPLNVQRIASCSLSPSDGVVMVKLTDEMFAALEACQKSGKSMRIRVEEQGGTIEIGDGAASSMTNNTFRFQKQVLPYPTDAIVQTGNKIRNVGTYKTKYQIQATDKSFEETRKRAEKRAEVEKSRGTKDLPKATTANSGSSRYLSHSSNSTPKSSTLSKVSPTSTSTSASTSSQKTPTPDNMMKSNLLSQPIRKRIAHLIVTQKYKSWEEIYAKLSSDGLSPDCDGSVVKSFVKKLGDFSTSSPYLYLLPNFMSEVNFRWPFYTTEEKELVRKIQQKAANVTVQPQDSSFAPTRRKGMEKMTASSRRNPTDSSLSAPPPKPAEKTPEKPAKIEEKDEEMDIPAPQGIKRKAHVPQGQTPQEKRAKTVEMIVKPPPTTTTVSSHQHQNQMHQNHNHHHNHHNSFLPPNLVAQNHSNNQHQQNGGGSTASSRVSSPASSLSSPSQPSCDWEKEYGEIKTTHQAEQYFGIFQKDYPIYMECYRKLTDVSKEFRELERKLRKGDKNVEVEKCIQTRYGDYEKDPEFMRVRQKHTDLRSKLAVLKNRIGNWKPSSSSSTST